MSHLKEMLTMKEQDFGSKQTKTFLILQQNATTPNETGETIPVSVRIPQNRNKRQQRESHYCFNEHSKLFTLINIDDTAELATEAKHLVKKIAKPETSVAIAPHCFALSDTIFSAVDHFTVNHQQLKADKISIHMISFVSTERNLKTTFLWRTLIIIFSQLTY